LVTRAAVSPRPVAGRREVTLPAAEQVTAAATGGLHVLVDNAGGASPRRAG